MEIEIFNMLQLFAHLIESWSGNKNNAFPKLPEAKNKKRWWMITKALP